ncbi:MAG: hypothetical protein RLP15_13660 [Cryomorphaceae bacterium]
MNADFIEWLGDMTLESFALLRLLADGHNFFNWLIISIMAILAVIWVKKMVDFNREADQNGTLR